MKVAIDSRFGQVCAPASFSEAIKLLRGHSHKGRIVHMWRGQASDQWPLHSSAYRRLSLGKKQPSEKDVRYYEKELLNLATHRGFRFYEGRELSDFELLARLQHHGAATRLVDTTRNALVALYFACSSQPKQAGLLFGIHSDSLGGGEGRVLSGDYTSVVDAAGKHDHSQTWQPPDVSRRIAVQHSQFIYSKVVEQSHGSIAVSNPEANLFTVKIAAALKPIILRLISEMFDVNQRGLFPDIDGFGNLHGAGNKVYDSERW